MKKTYYERIKMNEKLIIIMNKKISTKNFEELLKKHQIIDENHYKEKITIDDMKRYLDEYKMAENASDKEKKVLILLAGNPEIVFKCCLETLNRNLDMTIAIQDYCLAQNTLIVDAMNDIIKNNNLKSKLNLKNLLKDTEIINE